MGSGKSVLYQFSAETPAAEMFTNCKSVNCSKMTSPLRDVFCNRDVASSHLVKVKMNQKISKSFWRLVSIIALGESQNESEDIQVILAPGEFLRVLGKIEIANLGLLAEFCLNCFDSYFHLRNALEGLSRRAQGR